MKRVLALLAAVAGILACDGPEEPEKEKVKLQVSPVELSIDEKGGEVSFSVTSAEKPYIVGSYNWCRYFVSAFTDHKTTVNIEVSENNGTEAREADFSVVCGDEKIKVRLTQEGVEEVIPEPSDDFLAPVELPKNNAVAVAAKLGAGWNLGNQMDAIANGVSSETCWGNPLCTQATLDGVKAKGFSTVRIPVTWMGHIGEAPEYTLDEVWLNRVAEIAGYAKKAGLNAIINIHHDDSPTTGWLCVHKAAGDPEFKADMMARYKALWKQVAEKFADEGDWLIFESYNELQDGNWGWGSNLTDGGKQYAIVNELASAFVETVREAGGKNAERYLSVLGYSANAQFTIDQLVLPEDSATDRLMVSVHYYDPSGYALGQNSAYTEWGHTGAAGKKDPGHSEQNVVETFKKLKEKYVDNNIPVYLGETGAVNRNDARAKLFQQYWFQFVYKAAKEYGLAPIVWDNGAKGTGNESFGFISHSTGDYINDSKPVIDVINKVFKTETQSYTLESVYNNAPK